jgi:hypothetical protein
MNPLDTLKKFRSRLGKPVRPIIELQKNGSIVNVNTTTVQTENLISDVYRGEAWELSPGSVASAIYVDGLFKGMGFFVGDEGVILTIRKDVEIHDEDGKDITMAYKGVIGRLLDASLLERGSALKPTMTQVLFYAAMAFAFGAMVGASYGK